MIHEWLNAAAEAWPDKVAVVDRRGTVTFGRLRKLADKYAVRFAGGGLRAGDRVLIRAEQSSWVLAAIGACSALGAVAVPLPPGLPEARWEGMRADAQPTIEVTGPPDTSIRQHSRGDRRPPAGTALFLYTSGSTSTPKAIVCCQQQVEFASRVVAERLGYQQADVVLCRLPLSFDYGLYQWFMAVRVGATVVLCGAGEDASLLSVTRRQGVTIIPLVPSLADLFDRLGNRGIAPGVRLLTNTGQELTVPMIERLRKVFPASQVQLMYGTTECQRITIADPDHDRDVSGCVGMSLPGTQVEVVGADESPVPLGAEGEVVVMGPHLMSGYWGAPELTAAVFRARPGSRGRALHTGDYGHLDEDGHLHFHGRRDDIFKHRGLRCSVTEIEAAASALPGVREAAVVPPEPGTIAYSVFVTGTIPSERLLRDLRSVLEPEKLPDHARVLVHLPTTAHGKTDRRALRELALRDYGAGSA